MGFAWVTNIGVGADIDAADRVETKTNIASLYTDLGKNWPGNVRFPACGGAGYDMGAPCAVVWDIAPDEDIYQTPGAHPVSELQEARDKLDWIHDNMCGAENVGHDSPENAAANPTTQSPAQSLERAITHAVAQSLERANTHAVAQSLERAITETVAQSLERAVTQTNAESLERAITQSVAQELERAATQSLERSATQYQDQMGCVTYCPYADTGANPNANNPHYGDLVTFEALVAGTNYSGDDANDRGTVRSTNFYENWPILFYGVLTIYNTPYCSSENSGVFTHVCYSDG